MRDFTDINWIFLKHYKDNPELRRIVVQHSRNVAKKALEIVDAKHLKINRHTVFAAALLHDIGVVNCKAPEIHAHGPHHYIQHGLEGSKILESYGLYSFAGVCRTHTGAGLTAQEIAEKQLPMPKVDMLPRTLLEKLICYADKFYSKSGDLNEEKSLETVRSQLAKHGEATLKRFDKLHALFG